MVTSASQVSCRIIGAVTFTMFTPISSTVVPSTTGGKKRTMRR